jgi:hypothetical protein
MFLRHSALTDFLAVYTCYALPDISVANIPQSHNISANQIRQDAIARRAAALTAQQGEGDGDENEDDGSTSSPLPEPETLPSRRKKETKAQSEKRKKEEEVRRLSELTMNLTVNLE